MNTTVKKLNIPKFCQHSFLLLLLDSWLSHHKQIDVIKKNTLVQQNLAGFNYFRPVLRHTNAERTKLTKCWKFIGTNATRFSLVWTYISFSISTHLRTQHKYSTMFDICDFRSFIGVISATDVNSSFIKNFLLSIFDRRWTSTKIIPNPFAPHKHNIIYR